MPLHPWIVGTPERARLFRRFVAGRKDIAGQAVVTADQIVSACC
jgi:hypothetical protein